MTNPHKKHSVFYSWQSDLANRTNRSFIEEALERAIDGLLDRDLVLEVRVDSDTRDIPGAPDIFQTILAKIDQATIFVGDVSIINAGSDVSRPTPNPNVLIELGYAAHSLSWDRVLPIFNLATGKVEDLPFDLRGRRPITYLMSEDTLDRKLALRELARKIQGALELIFQKHNETESKVRFVVQRSPLRFGVRNEGTTPITVEKFTLEFPQSIHGNSGWPFDHPPLVTVREDRDQAGNPIWRMVLVKSDAPVAHGYPDNWRLPPRIDAGETEIFEYPNAVIKEDSPDESRFRLKLAMRERAPIEVITTFGEILDPAGPFSL